MSGFTIVALKEQVAELEKRLVRAREIADDTFRELRSLRQQVYRLAYSQLQLLSEHGIGTDEKGEELLRPLKSILAATEDKPFDWSELPHVDHPRSG